MEGSILKGYLARNWFKLALALFLIFILLKKDLSFQIRLKAPGSTEQVEDPGQQMPARQPQRIEREHLSDKGLRALEKPHPESGLDEGSRFDLAPSGKSRKARKAMTELAAVNEKAKTAFMERFDRVAVSENKKFGIPASLILGNALLLSRAGEAGFVAESNNFFALPCTNDWRGRQLDFQSSCYRSYENAWTSFRDHSLFLTSGRLAGLRRQIASDDYKGWARALEKAGFYAEPNMARSVVELIETYRLYQLDR